MEKLKFEREKMKMSLSITNKLIITNQFKILEKLYPDDANYYSKCREAIEEGYTLDYSNSVICFSEELSEDECREVHKILTMYSSIMASYKEAEDKEDLEESDIKFSGFDGNYEINQYGYVSYLFRHDLYKDLSEGKGDIDVNSHYKMLNRYREMLEIWDKYDKKNGYLLTISQIKKLIDKK